MNFNQLKFVLQTKMMKINSEIEQDDNVEGKPWLVQWDAKRFKSMNTPEDMMEYFMDRGLDPEESLGILIDAVLGL